MLDLLQQRFQLYKQLNPNELLPEQFQKIEDEIKYPKGNTISDEYFDFKLWSSGCPSRQESFAKFLTKKLPKETGIKILEVGGGRTARLSRFLSKEGFTMTCIDPKLEKVDDNIKIIKGMFNFKMDISMYDYVVAQEPCEATEHVVRACVGQHIPFMMSLCGVPHKTISGNMPKDIEEWYNYLLRIAENEIKLRYVKLDPFVRTPILRSNKF